MGGKKLEEEVKQEETRGGGVGSNMSKKIMGKKEKARSLGRG